MEILVNGERKDLKLEEDTNLGEIIEILNKELNKAQMVMSDVLLNKERIDLQEKKDILAKEIEILEIKALKAVDLSIESLTEVGKYIPKLINGVSQIKDFLKEGKEIEAKKTTLQFVEGLRWMINVLKKSGIILKLDYKDIYLEDEEATVLEKIEALEKEDRSLQNELEALNWQGIEEVLDKLSHLLSSWVNALPKILQRYLKEENLKDEATAAQIFRGLKDSKEDLSKLSQELENISIQLQTGNEYEAMEGLQECTRTLENIFELLKKAQNLFNLNYSQIKIEKEDVASKIEEIKDILSEVVTAFENNDLVLLADLLEYELSPLISRFPEVINCLLSQIKKKIH